VKGQWARSRDGACAEAGGIAREGGRGVGTGEGRGEGEAWSPRRHLRQGRQGWWGAGLPNVDRRDAGRRRTRAGGRRRGGGEGWLWDWRRRRRGTGERERGRRQPPPPPPHRRARHCRRRRRWPRRPTRTCRRGGYGGRPRPTGRRVTASPSGDCARGARLQGHSACGHDARRLWCAARTPTRPRRSAGLGSPSFDRMTTFL
jgi:hypothetical protein